MGYEWINSGRIKKWENNYSTLFGILWGSYGDLTDSCGIPMTGFVEILMHYTDVSDEWKMRADYWTIR